MTSVLLLLNTSDLKHTNKSKLPMQEIANNTVQNLKIPP